MILAGVSPVVINAVCDITSQHFQDPEIFAIGKAYEDAVYCILGKPRELHHAGLFRHGLDSQVNALERILHSVSNYGKNLEIADRDATAALDLDDIKKSIHDAMTRAADDSTLPSSLRLNLLDLVSNFFDSATWGKERAKSILIEELLQAVWKTKMSDFVLDSTADKVSCFNKLIELSEGNADECSALLQILTEWQRGSQKAVRFKGSASSSPVEAKGLMIWEKEWISLFRYTMKYGHNRLALQVYLSCTEAGALTDTVTLIFLFEVGRKATTR